MENLKKDLLKLIDPSVNLTLQETKGLSHLGYDDENDVVVIEILVEKNIEEQEKIAKQIREINIELRKYIK